MKKLNNIIGIAGVLAIVTWASINFGTKAKAEQQTQSKHQVVILSGSQLGKTENGVFQYTGIFMDCSSSSDGAPQFPGRTQPSNGQEIPLAEALAICLDAGFQIRNTFP